MMHKKRQISGRNSCSLLGQIFCLTLVFSLVLNDNDELAHLCRKFWEALLPVPRFDEVARASCTSFIRLPLGSASIPASRSNLAISMSVFFSLAIYLKYFYTIDES